MENFFLNTRTLGATRSHSPRRKELHRDWTTTRWVATGNGGQGNAVTGGKRSDVPIARGGRVVPGKAQEEGLVPFIFGSSPTGHSR